ncbi:MAG: hypothetical protein J07HB67_01155 [halophilic archaeon J07HB67]|nr:MAG: hypothetical protein J07HB67_01155 [halophilic archaeon J07HB67]
MRPITRKFAYGLVALVVVLLALGALPSLLGTGEPYYLLAEPTAEEGPAYNLTAEGTGDLTQRRFQYFVSAANATDNRSSPYREGPVGVKESFSHSPFDELESFRGFAPENATRGEAVFVEFRGERYRVEVVRGEG